MPQTFTELSPEKQKELDDAVALISQHAAPGAPPPGVNIEALAAAVPMPEDLVVVQSQQTGNIQLLFPEQGGNLGFEANLMGGPAGLRARSIDTTRWRVKAVLKPAPPGAPFLDNKILGVGDWVVGHLAKIIDRHFKSEEGLIDLSQGYQALLKPAAPELGAAHGQRVLLFVHGIFSSIRGAFEDLGDPKAAGSTMQTLVNTYGGRVFGYDHWTISKTPLDNAWDLVNRIPADANWDVDIVCHSRGGPVVRALAAAPDAQGQLPASLRPIVQARAGRIKSIGTVIFVAGANQGSQLANGEKIKAFLNVAAALASRSPCMGLGVVIGLAAELLRSAFDLPSVQALRTDSVFINALNQAGTLFQGDRLYAARSAFDGSQTAWKELAAVADKFLMGVANDLVVPYDGVAGPLPFIPDERILNFGTPAARQGEVCHIDFFGNGDTHQFLLQHPMP